jgi:anoctamin-7
MSGDYIKYFQPITFVANYYGEKVGFYLAFLMFYTSWLLIPAVPGLALFIY